MTQPIFPVTVTISVGHTETQTHVIKNLREFNSRMLRFAEACTAKGNSYAGTWLNPSSFALRISQGKSINLNRAMSAHL